MPSEREEGGSLSLSLSLSLPPSLSSDRGDNADLVPLLTTKLETTTSPRWLPPVVGQGRRKRGAGMGNEEGRRRLSGQERERERGKWQVRGEEICGTWEGVGE